MKPHEFAGLVLLGAIWGASYLFIRIAAPALGPFLLMDARVLIAGAALIVYALIIGHSFVWREHGWQFLILGTIQSAVPFTLIAYAELTITASLAAILTAMTPLFTALVSAAILNEPLTARKIAGVLLGIFGVAVLVGFDPSSLSSAYLLAVFAMLGATLSYAFGGVYAKRSFVGVPSLTIATGQQVGAGLVLLLPALASVPAEAPPMQAVWSLLALALLSTSFAYLIYYYLLARVGPTKTLSVTFLVPLFATVWGALFLREKLTSGLLLGLVIILSSVALVTDVRVMSLLRPAGSDGG